MDTKKLIKFLVKAKINTYASSGEGGEKLLNDGSKEFEFKEREFKYRDRYFGSNPFMGQEIVFQNKRIVWGMNYYGKVVSKSISSKQIYQFLQTALREITEYKPFRGPNDSKQGDFEYFNKTEGTKKEFNGEETIFYKKKLVYRLEYHGGLVI